MKFLERWSIADLLRTFCNGSRSIAPIEVDFVTLVARMPSAVSPLLDHLKAVLAVKGSLRRSRWSRP